MKEIANKNSAYRKLAAIIVQLQRNYGTRYPTGMCSDRHLAKIIDPENEPVNAVGYWKRGTRFINQKYLVRIAELLNLKPEELKKYLEGDSEYENLLLFDEGDFQFLKNSMDKLAEGEILDAEQLEDAASVIENLATSQLSELYYSNLEILKESVSSDAKLTQLVELQITLTRNWIIKLEDMLSSNASTQGIKSVHKKANKPTNLSVQTE